MGLAAKSCGSCRGGVSPLTEEEAQRFLEEAMLRLGPVTG